MLTRFVRSVTAAALACSAIACPLGAQIPAGALAGDMKTLSTYRLTAPVLRKLARVQDNMYSLVVADPTLMTRYTEATMGTDARGRQSLDDMAKGFDRIPEMKRAIVNAGLTPREYSVAMLSVFQAVMTVSLMDMDGPMQMKEIPASVSPDNVAFVRAHKSELDRMMQKSRAMQRLARKDRDAEDQPDDSSVAAPPTR